MVERTPRVEWPTALVAILIYGAWLGLTWSFDAVPLPLAIAAGGAVIAWHGSLQHEAIHGHPTRSRPINAALAGAPLSLWVPYGVYRASHIAHHRVAELTDPADDPESFYVAPERWRAAGRLRRALWWATNTLVGRLVLGPAVVVARTWAHEARLVAAGARGRRTIWATHLVASAAVLAWVVGVCGIHPLLYVAAFVYPGLALTLLRSFAEHRPAQERSHRSAIVETNPVVAILFLNNNLHALHHDEPALPWYRLPARYRERRQELLASNGGYLFSGYGELARRFGVRAKDSPRHPGAATTEARRC
jgi:fatty acid desaturase